MLCAAVETTGSFLEWIVLYLSHFPEIQEKLQAEVSHVIGSGRFPQITDRPRMPYFQAFLQDVFRIAPTIPFGYHMAVEDTVFIGSLIKKGTCVLSNFYGVHMDPKLWEQPEKIRPERFIDTNGQFTK
ncbi:unnamed protein product [Allacma fusca]|uniref:Cytochrome P450 n=1 Tax=Allacma fusca TaxID=39272 RepID=A0A8J2JXC4_9HEXA|nr:unnamed protein product [Allacma fusca]